MLLIGLSGKMPNWEKRHIISVTKLETEIHIFCFSCRADMFCSVMPECFKMPTIFFVYVFYNSIQMENIYYLPRFLI